VPQSAHARNLWKGAPGKPSRRSKSLNAGAANSWEWSKMHWRQLAAAKSWEWSSALRNSSRHSFRRLLRSGVAMYPDQIWRLRAGRTQCLQQSRSLLLPQQVHEGGDDCLRPSTASSSKHARSEEQARLLSLARSCGNLRLRNHWSVSPNSKTNQNP